MARLVVLRFDDDDEADIYVQSVKEGHWPLATVEMMVQAPTKFCDCSFRGDGFSDYGSHGWLLHSCGKPTIGWGENARAVITESVDLLEKKSGNTRSRIEMANQHNSATDDIHEQQHLHDSPVDVPTGNLLRDNQDIAMDTEDNASADEVDYSVPVVQGPITWPTDRDVP